MNVSFRPVKEEDEDFLLSVYASTREEEMTRVSWSDAQKEAFLRMQFDAQALHYRERYPDASLEVILADGNPAGRLYKAVLDDEIRIIDITLLPRHRGYGIGTPIIRDIMAEAARIDRAVRIHVETFNRSLSLFRRLGFVPIEDNEIYTLMEWRKER
ncbi:MAG: GNAT family N-acetyltransferase [Acidobacteriota bacterium]